MLISEATFGRTPCYIHVRRIARPGGQRSEHVAELCVIESEGCALRFVADQAGNPVVFAHATADDAVALARRYLEKRFGLPWASTPGIGPPAVRTINEPPLRDRRSGRSRAHPRVYFQHTL